MFHTYHKALVVAGLVFCSLSSAFAYSGGSGTPGEPYQIATKTDLLALAVTTADYNKCLILTADINMGGEVFTKAIIAADTNSSWWGFQGTAFTGIFDGNGLKITNFTINGGSNDCLGLFGQINSVGSVKNLGLENYSVSGDSYAGSLVGFNYGSISNCYSTGAVSGSTDVGGMVGINHGSISNCYSMGTVSGWAYVGGLLGENRGSISNCYSTGAVYGTSGASTYVGGLVGLNYSGSISNCYSTGAVSGDFDVGGLAGENDVSISNCYSTGTVSGYSGSYTVGGLVGQNFDSISNCYSTGAVSGSSDVGGLVGLNYGSVFSSFWDKQTSGQTTSAGGTGKTTAEMKTLLTFTSAGWDFVDAWGIGNGQTYPYLKPFNGINPADINYSGTVDFVDFAILAANWLEGS
jgi:hypothetical protein